MKKSITKIISLIISFALAVNLLPISNVKAETLDKGRKNYGFVEPNFKITRKAPSDLLFKSVNFPSKYDLRTLGKVTPVKNQGNIGDCWAFAAMGSVESNILMKDNVSNDFSEINLAANNGYKYGPNDGGNCYMSTAYFARWGGPVNEKDDPNPNPPEPTNINSKGDLSPVKHVQDVLFVPDRNNANDNDLIKQSIMNYGAMETTIYMDADSYYNPTTCSYYNGSAVKSNHQVDIVGWDDSYSKSNFKTIPQGDGAFICRNSWGTNWGDKGYFYVSYYDACIGKYNALVDDSEPINNYNHVYQYDPLGMGGALSYSKNTAWFSNVFKSEDTEKLSAVSFYTNKMNTSYEVYVENDYDDNTFTKITSNKVKTGSIEMPGYHTIKLDNKVNLIKGKKFAVAVKINCSDEADITIENTNFKDPNTVVSLEGQSYISSNGSYWRGIAAGSPNVCLKAFTDPIEQIHATGISMSSSSVQLNSGDTYKLSAEVLPSNATLRNVTWTTSNSDVASVDQNGNVTAGNYSGTAVITATSVDGNYTSQCAVTVKGNLDYTDSVYFESPYLEKAVRDSINKPSGSITSNDMKMVQSLNISNKNINSLRGLEYAVNLDLFNAESCNIYDASVLKNLKNLEYLYLDSNHIKNIDFISNLTKLKSISFFSDFITDVSPLVTLVDSQGTNASKDSISLNYNCIDMNNQDNVDNINKIKSKVDSFYSSGEKSGAEVSDIIGGNPDGTIYPSDSFSIIFKNNIQKSTGFNHILFYYNDNGNSVNTDISVNISGNRLVIKPKKPLIQNKNISYYLYVPDNAVVDSQNKASDHISLKETVSNVNGDINNDGNVDIKDIAQMGQNYETTVNDKSWNTNCDFNYDGRIDIYDLVKEAQFQ